MPRHLKDQENKPVSTRLSPDTLEALEAYRVNNGLRDTAAALRVIVEQAMHGIDEGAYRAAAQNARAEWYSKVNAGWQELMQRLTEYGSEK